jgi:DNA-directed RNA polymerase subunit RPC12/RpoP
MPIASCPSCGASLRISQHLVYARLHCPRCGVAILLKPVKKKLPPSPELQPAEESQALPTREANWAQPDENVSFYEERPEPQPWFYKELGKEKGPLSYEALVRLAAEKDIGPETRVRQSGSQEWVIACKVPGLFVNEDKKASTGTKPF